MLVSSIKMAVEEAHNCAVSVTLVRSVILVPSIILKVTLF
jgi:hypothetical protein